jgi:hypothetical protein
VKRSSLQKIGRLQILLDFSVFAFSLTDHLQGGELASSVREEAVVAVGPVVAAAHRVDGAAASDDRALVSHLVFNENMRSIRYLRYTIMILDQLSP